jgi:hypothetical protein
MAAVASFVPATPKQIAFIQALAAERGVALKPAWQAALSRATASQAIERLLAMPAAALAKAQATPAEPAVPAGRYAVEVDGALGFFRVDRPAEGRWAGRTFVSVQASDEFYPVRARARRARVLAAIAADPAAASARYGQELGVCGVCGRTLTDATSRQIGIGPICRERMGWA